jgi:hypothetical protein
VVTTIIHRYEITDGPMIVFIIMLGLFMCTTQIYRPRATKVSIKSDDDSKAKE